VEDEARATIKNLDDQSQREALARQVASIVAA
jgi:hypothetical protein